MKFHLLLFVFAFGLSCVDAVADVDGIEGVSGKCKPAGSVPAAAQVCEQLGENDCPNENGCAWHAFQDCIAKQTLAGGGTAERHCAFPFKYKGTVHNRCTREGWSGYDDAKKVQFHYWCPLRPEIGIYEPLGEPVALWNYDDLPFDQREWGYCTDTCPTEELECGVFPATIGADQVVSDFAPSANSNLCHDFGDWNVALSPCRTCACKTTASSKTAGAKATRFIDKSFKVVDGDERVVSHPADVGETVCTQPRWKENNGVFEDFSTPRGKWYSTKSNDEFAECAPVDGGGATVDECVARIDGIPHSEQEAKCQVDDKCEYFAPSGCGRHSTVESCEANTDNLCFWNPVCPGTGNERLAETCYKDVNGELKDEEPCSMYKDDRKACEAAPPADNCVFGKAKTIGGRRRRLQATPDDPGGRGATRQLCDNKQDPNAECYHRWCTSAHINSKQPCEIPYLIDASFGQGTKPTAIKKAFQHIADATEFKGQACLKFKSISNLSYSQRPDWFMKPVNASDPPCASLVGIDKKQVMPKKGQPIWLNANEKSPHCFKEFGESSIAGNVVHEILHAVGLLHEHSRRDRDDHIKVTCMPKLKNWSYDANSVNSYYKPKDVCANIQFALNKHEIQLTPYDCDSIMHYGCDTAYGGSFANFSLCSGDRCKDCAADGAWPGLGQRETMSPYDIWSVREMYCPHLNDLVMGSLLSQAVDVSSGFRQPPAGLHFPAMTHIQWAASRSQSPTSGLESEWSTREECPGVRGSCTGSECGHHCLVKTQGNNGCTIATNQQTVWGVQGNPNSYLAETRVAMCGCPENQRMHKNSHWSLADKDCNLPQCKPSKKCYHCLAQNPPQQLCATNLQCKASQTNGHGFKCTGMKWLSPCSGNESGQILHQCIDQGGVATVTTKSTCKPVPAGGQVISSVPAPKSSCPADGGLTYTSGGKKVFIKCEDLGKKLFPNLDAQNPLAAQKKICTHKKQKYRQIIQNNCKTTCCKVLSQMHGADLSAFFVPSAADIAAQPLAVVDNSSGGLDPNDTDSILLDTGRCTKQGGTCVFPFIYRGVEWQACLPWEGQHWCSLTNDYDRDGQWGYCTDCVSDQKLKQVIAGMKKQQLLSQLDAVKLATIFDAALDFYSKTSAQP